MTQPPGAGRFVKRETGPGDEAARYRRLAAIPGLAPYLPREPRFDDERGLLLLTVEDGTRDLWDHHLGDGRFRPEVGRAVGRALAVLHHGTRIPPRRAPTEAPHVLGLHRPPLDALRTLSPASRELIATVQRHEAIGRSLDELRAGWTRSCLVHGDVKWPNVLVVPRPGGGPPLIRLVDWEHAHEGDPAWDVGCALGAYVTFWLYSIPTSAGGDPAELAARAEAPLAGMRSSIQACWDGYRDAAELESAGAPDFMRRAVAFSAARLIRTAHEECDNTTRLSGRAALHLQVAANVLADPDAAAGRLLGLDVGPRAP